MISLRLATIGDLPGTYRVCLLTGDESCDATAIYRNPDLLGHVFVGPYVVGEPDLAFVIADDDGVAGYALATADTRGFEAWAAAHWWPPLREQYPPRDDGSPDAELIALIHAPSPASESLVRDFPAHLHIDLLERVRGRGFGRLMIERLLSELRERASPGVHLDVAIGNARAIAFYHHLGFHEVERGEASIQLGMRLTSSMKVC